MKDWLIYKGTGELSDNIKKLPAPPSTRDFVSLESKILMRPRPSQAEVEQVNIALYLRRPLLVITPPGCGSESIACAVAAELNLGKVLYWSIRRHSSIREGLYQYEEISRNEEISRRHESYVEDEVDIGHFIRLGPLGTALFPTHQPRVLLIDNIDKGADDFLDDLSVVIEQGTFEIPELVGHQETWVYPYDDPTRVTLRNGLVRCQEFPLIILLSYGERELPSTLTRICIGLELALPTKENYFDMLSTVLGREITERYGREIDELLTQSHNPGHNSWVAQQVIEGVWLAEHTGKNIEIIFQQLKRISSGQDSSHTKFAGGHIQTVYLHISTISTGGGAFVDGNVKPGGDFIGRDKSEHSGSGEPILPRSI